MKFLFVYLRLRWDLWQLCRKGFLVKKQGRYEPTLWAEAHDIWGGR